MSETSEAEIYSNTLVHILTHLLCSWCLSPFMYNAHNISDFGFLLFLSGLDIFFIGTIPCSRRLT